MTSGSQSNTPYTVAGEVTRSMDSEALANTALPLVPSAPDVPATIGPGAFQDPSVIAALAVDPNRTMIDDLLEKLKHE